MPWLDVSVNGSLYIKRMYADDPCLRNAKIVYSIYNDDFKEPAKQRFRATKLKADGAKEADLEVNQGRYKFVGLTKLAIDFADGVIQGMRRSIKKSLIISLPRKMLLFPISHRETYMDEFNKFYDVVLDSNTK